MAKALQQMGDNLRNSFTQIVSYSEQVDTTAQVGKFCRRNERY